MIWELCLIGLVLEGIGSIFMIVFDIVKYDPKTQHLYVFGGKWARLRNDLRRSGIFLLFMGLFFQVLGSIIGK